MKTDPTLRLALVVVFAALGQTAVVRAQDVLDLDKAPVLPRDFSLLLPESDAATAPAAPRPNRIRLFRLTPGFLSDPVGLDTDDTPTDPDTPQTDNGPDWINLTLGNDNPFFDIRRPGDPGGVGYYRVQSQIQLFDSRTTAFTVNFSAVTPAGRDQDGLADGPTVVTPSVAVYQELLGDGTALQGYVGKDVHLAPGWTSGFNHSIQYALALQRPLLDPNTLKLGAVYWYFGALGRYHFDADPTTNRAVAWELMPGVHWQFNDKWWVAAGFIVPMQQPTQTQTQTQMPLWQLTCSIRF